MQLLTGHTPLALWHAMVHEAETKSGILLAQDVEAYLVLLLMRFVKRPELVQQIIALDYLHLLQLPPSQRSLQLQEVGDKCLLFSGLFPKVASKRLVKVNYYIHLGKSAYASVPHTDGLFESLAKHFVPLMDVLHEIREYTHPPLDLSPLDAYELWNETCSQYALKILKTYTRVI